MDRDSDLTPIDGCILTLPDRSHQVFFSRASRMENSAPFPRLPPAGKCRTSDEVGYSDSVAGGRKKGVGRRAVEKWWRRRELNVSAA